MPANNNFAHQQYTAAAPSARYELIRPTKPMSIGDPAAELQLQQAVKSLQAHNVGKIYLVHGTIVGTDTLGVMREIGRMLPNVASFLGQQEKAIVDAILGDTANYSPDYAHQLEQAFATYECPIAVERFSWSSENHHFGRAEAAVRLIQSIRESGLRPKQRVLLWGHSHAGNVFALVSNLLGGRPESIGRMFSAAGPLIRQAKVSQEETERSRSAAAGWSNSRQLIQSRLPNPIDFVTFGTPIRYGWESNGYRKLLHFVNHRPVPELPPYLVPFPLTVEQLVTSECGDFFQQLFIAGTNFPPNLLAWRLWSVERKLGRLFERGQTKRNLWVRLEMRQRVPSEGDCLLVDYAASDAEGGASMFGHGVYTRSDWLAFHLFEVAKRFYGDSR